jgi:hypothetical protein
VRSLQIISGILACVVFAGCGGSNPVSPTVQMTSEADQSEQIAPSGGARGLAEAEGVKITHGSIVFDQNATPRVAVNVGGSHGFNLEGALASDFNSILHSCNFDPNNCAPGNTLSLQFLRIGSDISALVTFQGNSLPVGSGAAFCEGLTIQADGFFLLPAEAPTATVRAPFTFTGSFGCGGDGMLPLEGNGTATAVLDWGSASNAWHLTTLVYDFGGRKH